MAPSSNVCGLDKRTGVRSRVLHGDATPQACANRGAQILVYPGAFNTVTGPLHWELLQRARAVDNQLFVLTCSPARMPGASYQAWGHSTAVGPFAVGRGSCMRKKKTQLCTNTKNTAVHKHEHSCV